MNDTIKKYPLRTCCGCNEKKPAATMLRITFQPPDALPLDGRKKANGRGAYLCRDRSCLELAVRKKAFHRAFRTNLPPASVEKLRFEFLKNLMIHDDK